MELPLHACSVHLQSAKQVVTLPSQLRELLQWNFRACMVLREDVTLTGGLLVSGTAARNHDDETCVTVRCRSLQPHKMRVDTYAPSKLGSP